jgi:hypothetical protein
MMFFDNNCLVNIYRVVFAFTSENGVFTTKVLKN